jgi:hypothetical protein
MPETLHHIVVDAHDLPGLARFWAEALGWLVLSEREREVVYARFSAWLAENPTVHAPAWPC